MAQKQGGKAVSLNLSFGRESGAYNAENPLRSITRRISEALLEHGLSGLPMAWHLEAVSSCGPDEGRLHLHGVVITAPDQEAKVKRALRQGAGFVRGHAGSTQIKLVRLTDGDGWHRYVSGDKRHTLNIICDDRLTYTSKNLTRLAKAHHEEQRKATIKAAVPVKPKSCSKAVARVLH